MNQSKQIHTTTSQRTSRKSPCVRTHTPTSHDSSNHPHSRPRAVRRSTPSHESRLVKSPTPAGRRSKPFLSCPRRRLDVARRSIASRRLVVVVVDARRVRVYRANDCANENPLVPSPPRAPARRRRPRRGERERSDDRATLDRRFARSTRRTEGRIGDRATRSRASAVREFEVNESMRTNRWDRIGSTRRVGSRPRLANDCANDARE